MLNGNYHWCWGHFFAVVMGKVSTQFSAKGKRKKEKLPSSWTDGGASDGGTDYRRRAGALVARRKLSNCHVLPSDHGWARSRTVVTAK